MEHPPYFIVQPCNLAAPSALPTGRPTKVRDTNGASQLVLSSSGFPRHRYGKWVKCV
jgi:hypothetical protein